MVVDSAVSSKGGGWGGDKRGRRAEPREEMLKKKRLVGRRERKGVGCGCSLQEKEISRECFFAVVREV